MVATGQLPKREEPEGARDSSFADLGTVIHFVLQDGIRASFPGPAIEYAPTEEEVQSASTLHGDSLTELNKSSRDVARLAMEHLPKLADGLTWNAEVGVEAPWMQGHIDLLAPDGSWLVDLKTTARKPIGGKPKPAHVIQVLCYAILAPLPVERVRLLYVDSMRAQWVLPVDIDCTDPDVQELAQQIEGHFRGMVEDPAGYALRAVPSIGPKCGDSWCPHTAICRDKYFKFSGTVIGSDEVSPLAGIRAAAPLFGA
jgi:hypothetical protein